jgi:hypothetical protein
MRKENTQMFELLERFAAAIPPEPGTDVVEGLFRGA